MILENYCLLVLFYVHSIKCKAIELLACCSFFVITQVDSSKHVWVWYIVQYICHHKIRIKIHTFPQILAPLSVPQHYHIVKFIWAIARNCVKIHLLSNDMSSNSKALIWWIQADSCGLFLACWFMSSSPHCYRWAKEEHYIFSFCYSKQNHLRIFHCKTEFSF